MTTLAPAEARDLLAAARVARLATVDAEGRPHLVPFVFAPDGDLLWSAVDAKPKRSQALKRLANIAANPAVSVLADHYDDADWTTLWWARADGVAHVFTPDAPEARRAVQLLTERYTQYRDTPPPGPVIAITVDRWTGWSAS